METAKFRGTPLQAPATVEQAETRETPTMTVSTAALRVGLAHLIHEINTPLQLVYGAARLMELHMPNASGRGDPFIDKVFRELKGGIDELISLVSSLRFQLESLWQINPSFESLDLRPLLEDVLQSEAMRFEAGGIRVSNEIVSNLGPIQGNKELLEHVFRNLFKNALDAMPKGGVLSVKASARQRSVYFEISDTGVGISPGLDVFQPFATSKPGGLGLGLTITRHIVEAHGGTITCQSQPGKGATFSLSFPSQDEANQMTVARNPVTYERPEELYGCLCHAPRK